MVKNAKKADEPIQAESGPSGPEVEPPKRKPAAHLSEPAAVARKKREEKLHPIELRLLKIIAKKTEAGPKGKIGPTFQDIYKQMVRGKEDSAMHNVMVYRLRRLVAGRMVAAGGSGRRYAFYVATANGQKHVAGLT